MKSISKTGDLAPDKDRLHIGVFAESGGGKTYWMNEVHKACDCASIMVAQDKPADDYDIYGVDITLGTSKQQIKQALKQGKKLHLDPASNGKAMLKQVQWLYGIAKEVNVKVVIFIDEVHRIAGEAMGDMITDGRGFMVHFVYSTQYMDRLSNKSARAMVYGIDEEIHLGVSEEMKGFYRYYSIPWKAIKEETEEEYSFVRRKDGEISEPMKL